MYNCLSAAHGVTFWLLIMLVSHILVLNNGSGHRELLEKVQVSEPTGQKDCGNRWQKRER